MPLAASEEALVNSTLAFLTLIQEGVMKPLKRLEVIKEIVEIFERDELSETLDKF